MALRLAGQPFPTIQGSDAQGWLREITVNDAIPGLKINQQRPGRVFDFQDGGTSKLYLPDAGNVTLGGSLVFDLANDVTVTATSPAAPRTLTGKTLTSPSIQGTVGAGTGLTMPGFNMTRTLAFQQASTLSTTSGNLTPNPARDIVASKRIVVSNSLNLEMGGGGIINLNSAGYIANVGNAGNDWTATAFTHVGHVQLTEMSAPGGGTANTARIYAVDNGSGKTPLAVVFATGAAQILATEP